MSNTTRDTLSNTRNIKNAMERLADLEQSMTMLMGLLDRELGTVVTQVNALSEVLNAITEVVGLDAVQAVLTRKAEEKRDAEQKQLDTALAEGKIVETDKIGPASIIAYEERDADGKVRIPGKFFKNVASLAPDAKKMLQDQFEGFVADIGNGAKMTVLKIWDMLPPKAEEVPAAPALAAVPNLEPVAG